jgi:predicted anti-sigma-YlaC factor YlaD
VTYEDIPCRHVVELVTEFLEGVLPIDDVIVVERHLAMCEGCAAYLEQMRETIRVTGGLRDTDVPRQVMEPLVEAFRNLRR